MPRSRRIKTTKLVGADEAESVEDNQRSGIWQKWLDEKLQQYENMPAYVAEEIYKNGMEEGQACRDCPHFNPEFSCRGWGSRADIVAIMMKVDIKWDPGWQACWRFTTSMNHDKGK